MPLKGEHKSFIDILKHISTEVVEATHEYSNQSIEFEIVNGKPYGLASELADVLILTVLAAKRVDIDLNDAVNKKIDWLEENFGGR